MGLFEKNTQGGLMRYFTDPGKYVKDFRIEEAVDEKGRIRRKAVYTGTWTVIRNPGTAASVKLWGTLLLSAILAGGYIRMLLLTHLTSGRLEVMIPLLAGLFPLLYLLMGSFSLPFRMKPMRSDQYMHSFIRASRSCTAVGIFALLGLVCTLILRTVWGNWSFFPEDRLFVLLCLVVPLLSATIILILRSIDLTEKASQGQPGF